MDDVDKLLDRIRANGDEVSIAGPQSEKAIAELEQALGVPLPPSYREFLLRFGGLGIFDSVVSGVIDNKPLARGTGRLYWDTQEYRRDQGLPAKLLVVQPDEDAPYCLDTSKVAADGEMPLVCYDLQSRRVERMGSSFGKWFVDWLRLQAEEDA